MSSFFSKIATWFGTKTPWLFNLSPAASLGVLTLIGLIVLGMANCAHASESLPAGSDTTQGPWVDFQVGSAVIRGYTPAIGIEGNFPLPITRFKSYVEVGMLDVGTSNFNGVHYENNLIWRSVFLVNVVGGLDAGIGASYMDNPYPYNGTKTNAALELAYRFKSVPLTLKYEHFSDAGSVEPNYGRDILFVSYRF